MIFDMDQARAICRALPKYMLGVTPSKEEAEAAKILPFALDEITRLEDALVEERAKLLHEQHVGDEWGDMREEYCIEWRRVAREQLRAERAIG